MDSWKHIKVVCTGCIHAVFLQFRTRKTGQTWQDTLYSPFKENISSGTTKRMGRTKGVECGGGRFRKSTQSENTIWLYHARAFRIPNKNSARPLNNAAGKGILCHVVHRISAKNIRFFITLKRNYVNVNYSLFLEVSIVIHPLLFFILH